MASAAAAARLPHSARAGRFRYRAEWYASSEVSCANIEVEVVVALERAGDDPQIGTARKKRAAGAVRYESHEALRVPASAQQLVARQRLLDQAQNDGAEGRQRHRHFQIDPIGNEDFRWSGFSVELDFVFLLVSALKI